MAGCAEAVADGVADGGGGRDERMRKHYNLRTHASRRERREEEGDASGCSLAYGSSVQEGEPRCVFALVSCQSNPTQSIPLTAPVKRQRLEGGWDVLDKISVDNH